MKSSNQLKKGGHVSVGLLVQDISAAHRGRKCQVSANQSALHCRVQSPELDGPNGYQA